MPIYVTYNFFTNFNYQIINLNDLMLDIINKLTI